MMNESSGTKKYRNPHRANFPIAREPYEFLHLLYTADTLTKSLLPHAAGHDRNIEVSTLLELYTEV